MPDEEEKLDEGEAVARLNAALSLQYRSALQYSLVAAGLTGIEAQALGSKLTGFGDAELADVRRLIEKIVSFGGEPTT
jgi:bacterioferritin (cytochrome b1)